MKPSIGRIVMVMHNTTGPSRMVGGVWGPADSIPVPAIVTLVDDEHVHVTAFLPRGGLTEGDIHHRFALLAQMELPLAPSEGPRLGCWWWPERS